LKGSNATAENYVYGMQIYTTWCRKTPDELRDARNQEILSNDLSIRRTAERMLDRFYSEYPRKLTALFVFRAVRSFYKYQGMPLLGIKAPNQDSLAIRIRDHIPTDVEIRKMCDVCDLRDRLIMLILAETSQKPIPLEEP